MDSNLFLSLTEKQIADFTPHTAAAGVIALLTNFVDNIQKNGKGHFLERYAKLIVTQKIKFRDLDKLDASIPDFSDQSLEDYAEATNTCFIFTAAVFAIDAIQEFEAGRIQHAWFLVVKAERYLGMALGSNPVSKIPRIIKSDQATRNAAKKNEENRQCRSDALKYYQDHISEFSSLNAAAKQMCKIVPFKHKTVLGWLTQHHKDYPNIKKPSQNSNSKKT